ncbi:hypothetical protein B6N60_04232 [Richelia sinica FACHB-800]|uniref:Uncharacterized protein n=1 Tax=Richelia sinica FACHB-800 TaxID=1357546 RepID=A0A975TCG6_9NOST|nr:hypothetical protein B6N60_04232 [Richelia sinica FACHB-800]
MPRLIILDSGVLGIITNPKSTSIESQKCKLWYRDLLEKVKILLYRKLLTMK